MAEAATGKDRMFKAGHQVQSRGLPGDRFGKNAPGNLSCGDPVPAKSPGKKSYAIVI